VVEQLQYVSDEIIIVVGSEASILLITGLVIPDEVQVISDVYEQDLR
jgi:hypothetical protein